ncbi:MAG TPA: FG-GAP repeat protein, partial [Polyangiales bacterium]|nr:FG-GAP repeat protein [Polyangiales bacterium]
MRIGLLCLGVAFAFAACTDPAERTHLLVIVDADQSLRASIRYIDVEVRRVSQAAKVSDVVQSNRLMPGGVSGWPLDLRVSNPKAGSDYEVTATAKAADDSTLGVVRAVRPYVAGRTLEVRLHFDEACLARATPCASTYTCRAGMCIDAWGTTTTEPIEPPSEPQAERDAEPPPPAAEPATAAKPEPCDSAGSAAPGCSPTLLALELSAGELKPEFTPEHTTYTAELPLVAGEVVLQLRAAQSVELLANGAPVAEDGRLPVKLGIGDNHLLLTLNAGGSPARSYRLNLRRTGAQRARLTATHGSPGDAFGAGLAVSGDRLVVGAPSEDGSTTTTPPDEAALDSGAAYVFERNAAGLWEERAYLKADPIRAGAHFGIVVALDGDWL